MKAMLMTKALM
jgi:hypothetical protein